MFNFYNSFISFISEVIHLFSLRKNPDIVSSIYMIGHVIFMKHFAGYGLFSSVKWRTSFHMDKNP